MIRGSSLLLLSHAYIPVDIEVCGLESIEVKSNSSVVRVTNFNKMEQSLTKEEYSGYFTVKNTQKCGISKFELVYLNKNGTSESLDKASEKIRDE
jgi:hypothetical protein